MTAPATPVPIPFPADFDTVRRTRERRHPNSIRKNEDRAKIANRVVDFYRNDKKSRSKDEDARLQRYAKYRQWTEGANLPWDDASDVAIPDAAAQSLAAQDALYNAVVATRPAITARATNDADAQKARTLDHLLDTQFFEENNGEELVGEAVDLFVNEGVVTLYIPWVREMRNVRDMRILDPLQDENFPIDTFRDILRTEWPPGEWNHFEVDGSEGWDWRVEPGIGNKGTPKTVRFYTRSNGDLEMIYDHDINVFDGPKIIPLGYHQVVTPIQCRNLQAPSPSNPGGAPHVTITEKITVDEISRLRRDGFFDLIDKDEMERISQTRESRDETRTQDQQRKMQGQDEEETIRENDHGRLTLLRCFDLYDIDGDKQNEDVVWWVILETKTLCKAKYLTELYPMNPPKRPFAEGSYISVPGFREGISQLELVEGMHDLRKEMLDMGVDAGTLTTFPFGFYRPTSSVKPEPLKIWPGELHPLSNPQQDIYFPNLGQNNTHAFTFNMLTWAANAEEKLTTIGDVQQGRVPPGRSSALRTSGGIAQLMEAGNQRPERILRRFFRVLTDAYAFMHALNRTFLPAEKEFLVAGVLSPDEAPYQRVKREDLQGEFQFLFEANVGNASRGALQESLQSMLGLYVNELAVTLGIVTPENVYQLYRDLGRAIGPDPDRYLTPPSPQSTALRVMAEQALTSIINNHFPVGIPYEPPEEHLQKLIAFTEDPERFGLLDGPQRQILNEYMTQVQTLVQESQRQQQIAQSANAAGQAAQGQGTPEGGAQGVAPPQQQLQQNELADETLPSARGGEAQ